MRVILFAILLFVFSCTPQQRINRIVERHPQLAISDTIKYSKLVVYPYRKALINMPDSILSRMQPGDSIISVSKKGVTIIVRKKPGSTEIEASVPADTTRIDTSFVVNSIKVTAGDKVKLKKLRIIYLGGIILLVLIIYLIIKKIIG